MRLHRHSGLHRGTRPRSVTPMWECPHCGARFVTRNVWHSCGRYSLEALFAGCDAHVFKLYQRFAALVEDCGPVTIIPQQSSIAFQVRVRFATVRPLKSGLDVNFWFTDPHRHPRIRSVERFTPQAFGHRIRLEGEADFDGQLTDWVREAYAIGEQRNLLAGKSYF